MTLGVVKGAWLTLTLTHGEHAGKTICQLCHRQRANEGDPDPCLGMLPGVANACCGHGIELGWIVFENGIGVTFKTQAVCKFVGPAKFDPASTNIHEAMGGTMEAVQLNPNRPTFADQDNRKLNRSERRASKAQGLKMGSR